MTSDEHAKVSGRPSTSKTHENVNKMQELVLENRIITIHEVVDVLETSFGSSQTTEDNTNIRGNAANWSPNC